jgi:hypothetical protein
MELVQSCSHNQWKSFSRIHKNRLPFPWKSMENPWKFPWKSMENPWKIHEKVHLSHVVSHLHCVKKFKIIFLSLQKYIKVHKST